MQDRVRKYPSALGLPALSPALALALVLALSLAIPSSGPGQDDSFAARYSALAGEIKAIAASQEMGDAVVGIDVVEVASGRRIWGREPDKPLNPASNVKIVTAWAALQVLGPEYTYDTVIYGDTGVGSTMAFLAIEGRGDPSLSTGDLLDLAKDLHDRGLRKVTGPIVVDDTFFDDERLPFAFDRHPKSDQDSPFRAPVGAVSVNGNTLEVTVGPGPAAGSAGRVTTYPSGAAQVRNETITIESGSSNVRIAVSPAKTGSLVRVWGPVLALTAPITYAKRVEDPAMNAGEALRDALVRVGIVADGEVERGRVPTGARILAQHESLPLGSLLLRVGKESDNFYAEQILKTMGGEAKGRPASGAKGAEAVQELLARAGIDPSTLTYRNGSGLYDANLVSPSMFTSVLAHALKSPEFGAEFVSQLATGGTDGTLVHRYRDATVRRRVRAKTGTLDDTASLSGYVLAPPGVSPICFSIIANKAQGRVAVFRTFQEAIVTAIARFLWPAPPAP